MPANNLKAGFSSISTDTNMGDFGASLLAKTDNKTQPTSGRSSR